MVGLLLITHYGLGQSFTECARHFFGADPGNLAVMAVDKNDDPDQLLAYARSLIAHLDQGEGVLVLTDMVGGTPSNVASRLVVPGRIEAVAGLSLPMLVRSLCYCGQPLADLVEKALAGGREGVQNITQGNT